MPTSTDYPTTATVLIDDSGHFRGVPDLVIEVLSAETENEKCDREVKLKLYSSRVVLEYWIADWRNHQVQVYRHKNGILKLEMTLFVSHTLTSPLFPDFSCPYKIPKYSDGIRPSLYFGDRLFCVSP